MRARAGLVGRVENQGLLGPDGRGNRKGRRAERRRGRRRQDRQGSALPHGHLPARSPLPGRVSLCVPRQSLDPYLLIKSRAHDKEGFRVVKRLPVIANKTNPAPPRDPLR